MAGRTLLQSIRLAREATPGVAATPRHLWRGNGDMLEDQREVTFVEERIGVFGGADRTYIAKLQGALSLADTEATFEHLPVLFNALGLGTWNGAQGSAQGASGSTGLFRWHVPTTTIPPTISYTVEAGDNMEVEQLTYGLVTELTLSFAAGEAVKVSASLIGRSVERANAAGTFSAAGTLEQVETILAGRGTMYLSPGSAGAAYGDAAITAGNVLGGEVTFSAKWEPKFTVDSGNLFYHTAVWTDIEITGNLVFEHQVSGTWGAAGTAGQKAKWRDQEPQLLRLAFPGGTIAAGTTQTVKLLQIDLPIKWSKFAPLGDQNGNVIVTGDFTSKYNPNVPAAGRGTVTIARQGTCPFSGAI